MSDFCRACGASIPKCYGEGTCGLCDPEGVRMHKVRRMAEDNTILRVLVGSQAYGLSTEDSNSDRDEKGVCIEPLEAHLGFSEFDQFEYRSAAERTGDKDAKSGPGDLDLVIFSLKKFLRLALKGNPTIIEMFFIKSYIKTCSLGSKLQELYPHVVSKQAGKAFLGYMTAQKMRLVGERGGKDVNRPELVEKYGFDTKYAMHMLRLGFQGVELLERGYLTLPIEEDCRSRLRSVREGGMPLSEVLRLAGDLEGRLRKLLETSTLPDQPNQPLIEDWMIKRYWEWWKAQRILADRGERVN